MHYQTTEVGVQTEGRQTQPKIPQTVEVKVETEKPSTRLQVYKFADRKIIKTDSSEQTLSTACSGPTYMRMRLYALYPDPACGHTSPTDRDDEKLEFRQIEVRETEAPCPMQAELQFYIPDWVQSGF